MKKTAWSVLGVAFFCLPSGAFAQASVNGIDTPVLGRRVANQGQNHRVIETISSQTNRLGKVSFRTNAFTEIGNGMHYKGADGKWLRSEAKIEVGPEGNGIALKGAHKLALAPNINTHGSIELTTPDDKLLKSHVIGLSYYDFKQRKSAMIAEVKDSIGVLVGDNQVIYKDAFTDFKADIRYTYTLDGMEQDIILRERPPLPEEFGFDPRTTWLEVWTEFVDAPEPMKEQRVRKGWEKAKVDKVLDFGAMKIGDGVAFSMGDGQGKHHGLQVQKHWLTVEGRTFLIEDVSFRWSIPKLRALPEARRAALPGNNQAVRQVSDERIFPKRLEAKAKTRERIEVAMFDLDTKGFVVDYSITTSTNDFTFQGDTTYYVAGAVNLTGVTTIEGGAVIKYTNGASLNIQGTVNCLTESYRPAVLTSYKDNSVGETVASGMPSGTYADVALNLSNGGELHNLHIRYANKGIKSVEDYTNSHSQFVYCNYAMQTESATFTADNILMFEVVTGFYGSFYHGTATHLTFNQGTNITGDHQYSPWTGPGCSGPPSSYITLVNSLITDVSNNGVVLVYQDHVTITSSSGIYKTVGAASHYLAESSSYRNAGKIGINSALHGELRKKTTYAPIIFSDISLPSNTILRSQAQRDTDAPDLGYHYDPLDYILKNCTNVSGALVFTNGIAIGFVSRSSTLPALRSHSDLLSTGTATSLNKMVSYNTVQEQATTNLVGATGYLQAPLIAHVANEENAAYKFTRFSRMGGEGGFFDASVADAVGVISFQDCLFQGGNVFLGARWEQFLTFTLRIKNCLFERSPFSAYGGYAWFNISLENNLFWNCNVTLEDWTGDFVMSITAFDNLFYNGSILMFNWGETREGLLDDYNAYCQNPDPQIHDVILPGGFAFQTGPLGRFYLPSGSALFNAGSQIAPNAGLYHYTTTTNQTKEATSQIDIGFHYVALNSFNQPIDSDGDGNPDYLEDANGNGSLNSGETDWQNTYNSNNGLASGNGLQVFTPLK